MSYKEPEFMRELHKVREKLSREEKNLTITERIARARKDSNWVKTQVAKLKSQKKAS